MTYIYIDFSERHHANKTYTHKIYKQRYTVLSRKNALNALRIRTQVHRNVQAHKICTKFSQLVSIHFSVYIFILSVFSFHWFETSQVVMQTHPNMEPVLKFQLCDGMLIFLVTTPTFRSFGSGSRKI